MLRCAVLLACALLLCVQAWAFIASTPASRARASVLRMSKEVLVIGGTRFSGLYLWKELFDRGYQVTLFNRGKTALQKLPGESDAAFEARKQGTKYIAGDRKKPEDLEKLAGLNFHAIYDMNGREMEDTKPVADMFKGKVDHFVYMSSAGVYMKSDIMPHTEGDAVDLKSRHKGKLNTEAYLASIDIPYTAIRPTYIYGPMNYNPIEEFFFARLDKGRAVCVPKHGKYFTGLGHVKDLAVAMANVLGRDVAKGQIYNIQDSRAVTFTGLVYSCAAAMGMPADDVQIKLYDPKMFDLGSKKAFPMRPQHFYTSVDKAIKELDWSPKYDLMTSLKDSYTNDFLLKKAAGTVDEDFEADDIILNDTRPEVLAYSGLVA